MCTHLLALLVAVGDAKTGDAKAGEKGKFLSFIAWVAAFHRLAIAAAATGQWALASCLTHFDLCLRIGEEARTRKLPPYLAVVYDDMCRRQWAEMSRAGVDGFDVNVACLSIDKDILARAEVKVAQQDKSGKQKAVESVACLPARR